MNALGASIITLCFLSACSTLPAERQLIGMWTRPETETVSHNEFGMTRSYSKQMVDLTLRPDHTFVWSLHGGRRTDFGRCVLDPQPHAFQNPRSEEHTS